MEHLRRRRLSAVVEIPKHDDLSPMGITTLKLALVLHVGTAGTLCMDDAALTSAIGLTTS